MKYSLEKFGSVWGASGVQGFFGEGWWFHRLLFFVGLYFVGMTFVAKTTTRDARAGHMPTKDDKMTPKEWFPKCVHLTPKMWWDGIVLNAVGLTGPGVQSLLNTEEWQRRTKPFLISFMSLAKSAQERHQELEGFVEMLKPELVRFSAPVGLQINKSCPNGGLDLQEIINEAGADLDTASKLGTPLMLKFNLEITPAQAVEISRHPHCGGICVTNTFPFGKILPKEWWIENFGTADPAKSPLAEFGGGGLSGKPLLPLLVDWVKEFRRLGGTCHVNAGGGVLGPIGAIRLFRAGADSISLGTIAMLRPWMVQPTIWAAKLARVLCDR